MYKFESKFELKKFETELQDESVIKKYEEFFNYNFDIKSVEQAKKRKIPICPLIELQEDYLIYMVAILIIKNKSNYYEILGLNNYEKDDFTGIFTDEQLVAGQVKEILYHFKNETVKTKLNIVNFLINYSIVFDSWFVMFEEFLGKKIFEQNFKKHIENRIIQEGTINTADISIELNKLNQEERLVIFNIVWNKLKEENSYLLKMG